ncbi:MAG: alpha/beta hydrolase-fold protein [Planctomycetota bacterium]
MSRFRTLELSDPPYESAGLRHITVKTPNLVGRGDLSVFVPRDTPADAELPVVTLLHGVYGSHWIWAGKAGVHLTCQRLIDAGEIPPMLLAMPSDGLMYDGSAYLPHSGRRFDRWIVEDVPDALLELKLPTAPSSPHFIAGLSMGGYGALRLGATHPDRYSGFAGHSSITVFNEMSQFVEEPLDTWSGRPEDASVFTALKQNADRLPPFRFDCGVDDPLIRGNRTLHTQLESAGIPHTYDEFPGNHDWPYWTEHVATTLRFFGELASRPTR